MTFFSFHITLQHHLHFKENYYFYGKNKHLPQLDLFLHLKRKKEKELGVSMAFLKADRRWEEVQKKISADEDGSTRKSEM